MGYTAIFDCQAVIMADPDMVVRNMSYAQYPVLLSIGKLSRAAVAVGMKWLAIMLASVTCAFASTAAAARSASAATSVAALDATSDVHSWANSDEVRVTHLDLEMKVDFAARRLHATVVHSLRRLQAGVNRLVLDSKDLNIKTVELAHADGWRPTDFHLRIAEGAFGSALVVALDADTEKVRVTYSTDPGASGLQWLTPAQTAGKQDPFLYTQAQAIHARSFIPLQDSPAVRVTYNATIRTPQHMRAVMSAANNPRAPKTGVFNFEMPQPIPSYLIALAVGDLEFQSIGKRTGIYAEKQTLQAAVAEFEDTQSMLDAVEKRYGNYAWGRYDLLILPPSFPWGGMENPRLSFITPTVLAGDKSLVSLIAHELAHSWSGNTVTNATWADIWLNEGFTTYLTYRIMEDVYGKARSDMERVLGYQGLLSQMQSMDEADQRLRPDLRGRDPDDGFSDVPYEKGALLVTELEHRVGRAAFDEFLQAYFRKFAFQSITTEQFLSYLRETLIQKYPDRVCMSRVKAWIESPGIPKGAVLPESNAFELVDTTRQEWLAGGIRAGDIETGDWTVHEWLNFLNGLPRQLSQDQLVELDEAFALTTSSNSEILHSWLLLAIRNNYVQADSQLDEYLTTIGRRKLIVPLYRALLTTKGGAASARDIYERARPGYHVVARNTIEKLFAESEF